MPVFVSPKIGCSLARTHFQVFFIWSGNKEAKGGLGILLAWLNAGRRMFMVRISGRISLLKLAICNDIISVHAPRSDRTDAEKDNFYDDLHPVIAEIPLSEILILLGDWNGQIQWLIWGSARRTWVGHKKYCRQKITRVFRFLQYCHRQHLF